MNSRIVSSLHKKDDDQYERCYIIGGGNIVAVLIVIITCVASVIFIKLYFKKKIDIYSPSSLGEVHEDTFVHFNVANTVAANGELVLCSF